MNAEIKSNNPFRTAKKEILKNETNRIKTRIISCTFIVNHVVSAINKQLKLAALPPDQGYVCAIQPEEHLEFLSNLGGLAEINEITMSTEEIKLIIEDWLNRQRASKYGETLFPAFIYDVECYLLGLSKMLIKNDTEKQKLYQHIVMYKAFGQLCVQSVPFQNEPKKAPFFLNNSFEGAGRVKETLEFYVSDDEYIEGFPCFEEASRYFNKKSYQSFVQFIGQRVKDWQKMVKKQLFVIETQNISMRSKYCSDIINNCISETNIALSFPATQQHYSCTVQAMDHLKFLSEWTGLKLGNLYYNCSKYPQSIKEYEKKSRNWLNGRRAPNYGRTLFPFFIHEAEKYLLILSKILINNDEKKQTLYYDIVMYKILAQFVTIKVSLSEQTKRSPFFCNNSVKRKGPLKELLQSYATDHEYIKGFPSCAEEAGGYFHNKSNQYLNQFRSKYLGHDKNYDDDKKTSIGGQAGFINLKRKLAKEQEMRINAERERDNLRNLINTSDANNNMSTYMVNNGMVNGVGAATMSSHSGSSFGLQHGFSFDLINSNNNNNGNMNNGNMNNGNMNNGNMNNGNMISNMQQMPSFQFDHRSQMSNNGQLSDYMMVNNNNNQYDHSLNPMEDTSQSPAQKKRKLARNNINNDDNNNNDNINDYSFNNNNNNMQSFNDMIFNNNNNNMHLFNDMIFNNPVLRNDNESINDERFLGLQSAQDLSNQDTI